MPANAALPVDDVLGPDLPERSDTPEPDADRPVREFEALCAKHNLARGSAGDLGPFLLALGENKLLAMNFWSVVARLSDSRRGPALAPADALAAIIRGVAGESVDTVRAADASLVDKLERLLAGEDVAFVDKNQARQSDAPPVSSSGQIPPEAFNPSGPPDSFPPRSSPLLDPGPRGPRLVLRPEPAYDGFASDRRPAFDSLAGYVAADNRQGAARRIAGATLVLALAVGGWLLFSRGYAAWRQPGNSARDGIASLADRTSASFSRVDDSVRAGIDATRDAWRGRPVAPPATASGPQTAMTALPPRQAQAPLRFDASANPDRAAGTAPITATLPRHDESGVMPGLRRTHVTESGSRIVGDAPQGSARVVVPGELMRDRLISSRVPILPDGVASRRNAFVVVNAIVTSRGGVRDIRAVAGRPELRHPAIDAVSAWHYRPYLLNGTPVDVATTITVNFNGND